MLPLEHSAILLTYIKRYSVLKTIFWPKCEWPFYTGFTVFCYNDKSFITEIRTEAVMQALAAHDKRVPVMPLPSKRTSVNYHGQQQRQRDSRHGNLGQN